MDAVTLKDILVRLGHHPESGIATHLLDACNKTGLPVSYGLALIEKESGFRNVFGHDPTTSIPESWKGSKVTWVKYRYYKLRRGSRGAQGVGPAQLTYPGYQDQADRHGGCHKPYPNMLVAFSALKANTDRLGKEKGAAAYNGSGPAAVTYGQDFVRKQTAWHRKIT